MSYILMNRNATAFMQQNESQIVAYEMRPSSFGLIFLGIPR